MPFRGLASLFLLALTAGADTHTVTKIIVNGHETIYAQYVRDKDVRTEDLDPSSPDLISIQNFERKVMYELDPQSRSYVELPPQSPDIILTLAQWIARPTRTRNSGRTVNIYYETTDTGERREVFGRAAKHLLIRERRLAEPGACQLSIETDTDGWYVPASEAHAAGLKFYDADLLGGGNCHDTVLKHGEQLSRAFPLAETITTRDLREGAFARSSPTSVSREVLELSTGPLDKGLFEIPPGFKRVESLRGQRLMSWSDRLEMEWGQFERAVESWFE